MGILKKKTTTKKKATKKETYVVERIGKLPEVFTSLEEAQAFSKTQPGSTVNTK